MKLDIFNKKGKKLSKTINVEKSVFGIDPNQHCIYLAVKSELAAKRQGTSKSKGKSEVSGTGAKPFKQKGTGSARQGSKRSPQMRGGAVIFGPQVRSHAHKLPKKIRKLALKIDLSKKLKDGKLKIIDEVF